MTYAPPAPVDVDTPEPARAVGDESLTSLLREVRDAGLLRPRHGYYVVKVATNLVMLGAVWAAFVLLGNSWWQLVVAALLAFCYTQTGFIGHDIGHRQVAHDRRWAEVLGLLHGDLLLGFSYSWWVSHHNKHHGYPNHLERDSDITRRRVIFIPEQGHQRESRAKQFIVRHQHVLFFPLLLTEGIGLRVASFKAIRDGQVRRPRVEGAPHLRPPGRLPGRPFHDPVAHQGNPFSPGATGTVRSLHRFGVRSQSQRHADPAPR